MKSHQPGSSFVSLAAACDEGDRPVKIKIALSLLIDNSPHVSYAISTLLSTPPLNILKPVLP